MKSAKAEFCALLGKFTGSRADVDKDGALKQEAKRATTVKALAASLSRLQSTLVSKHIVSPDFLEDDWSARLEAARSCEELDLLREELDETVDWTDGAVWRSGAAEAAAAAAARQKGGGGTPLPPPEDICEHFTSDSEAKPGSAAAAAAAEPPETGGTPPPPPIDEEAGGGQEDAPSPPEPAHMPFSAVSDLRRQLDQTLRDLRVRLESESQRLTGENGRLARGSELLGGENVSLRRDNQALRAENAALRRENAQLRAEHERLRGGAGPEHHEPLVVRFKKPKAAAAADGGGGRGDADALALAIVPARGEEAPAEGRKRQLRLPPPPGAKRSDPGPHEGAHYGRGPVLRSILDSMVGSGVNAAATVAATPKLHQLGNEKGMSLAHAAASSDRHAAVLSLLLQHAAADGEEALAAALRRPAGSGAESSPFASSSLAPPPGEVAARLRLSAGALPLDVAVLHGALECASLLLSAGADVDARSSRLHLMSGVATALDIAAACGHVGVLRLLLRARADPNVKSVQGWSALHWAAEYARTDCVRLLLQHGADAEACDMDGLTPLDWALKSHNGYGGRNHVALRSDCHDERVSVLVELVNAGARAGPNGSRPDRPLCAPGAVGYPRTLLHACAGGLTLNSLPLLRKLLARAPRDADLDCESGAGGTPLDLAVHSGWSEGALVLLNAGADVDAADDHQSTPLMRAASLKAAHGGCDLVRLLALKGANLHAQDVAGLTALHYAVRYRQPQAVRTLRALGANPLLRDRAGRTPEALARAEIPSGNPERAAILEALCAPECPPRVMAPGEDATCYAEEVAITGPGGGEEVHLPERSVFISEPVAGPGFRLRRAPLAVAGGDRCCACVNLCIPGLCPCLLRGEVIDLAEEEGEGIDDGLIDDIVANLKPDEDPTQHPSILRSLQLLLAGDDAQRSFATAVHVARPAGLARFDPAGELKLGVVGLAGAMIALRRLLPDCPPDEGWVKRVKAALRLQAATSLERLTQLLLELDDDVSTQLASRQADKAARRMRGLWESRQGTAWLADARPCWRAALRAPTRPRSLPALMDALCDLRRSLLSVRMPLRVAQVEGEAARGAIRTVRLCAPSCLCAGGGCRATGVQYPLVLRQTAATGLGAFAAVDIPAGSLVSAFVGELVTTAEAERRSKANPNAPFYTLDLDAKAWDHLRDGKDPAVVDPERFGNVARSFNHSCKPSLLRSAVEWEGQEAGPLVFLYAGAQISQGQELTWDYFATRKPNGFICKCNSCAPTVRAEGGRRKGGS